MKVFTVQDGLPDNVVFELFEDSDGWIRVESMNGKMSYIKNDLVYLLVQVINAIHTGLKRWIFL
jgi:ligand-binding sensor domain-containing protein